MALARRAARTARAQRRRAPRFLHSFPWKFFLKNIAGSAGEKYLPTSLCVGQLFFDIRLLETDFRAQCSCATVEKCIFQKNAQNGP